MVGNTNHGGSIVADSDVPIDVVSTSSLLRGSASDVQWEVRGALSQSFANKPGAVGRANRRKKKMQKARAAAESSEAKSSKVKQPRATQANAKTSAAKATLDRYRKPGMHPELLRGVQPNANNANQEGGGVACATHDNNEKHVAVEVTEEVNEPSVKVPRAKRPLGMDKKCVHSRAYDTALRRELAKGASKENAKVHARAAGRAATAEWDKVNGPK